MKNSLIQKFFLFFLKVFAAISPLFFLLGCIASPPKHPENICSIFLEKEDWYQESKQSHTKWGVPIPIQMAIMHQESHFVADAQPPQPVLLGFIPWFRSSSAYGYAQAQDSTWRWYQQKTGNKSADRDDFADASDFIGWYCTVSHNLLGLSKLDTKNQYLAYHEGQGGYRRKSYLNKPWLQQVALKVERRAKTYRKQLKSCQQELENKQSFFW